MYTVHNKEGFTIYEAEDEALATNWAYEHQSEDMDESDPMYAYFIMDDRGTILINW